MTLTSGIPQGLNLNAFIYQIAQEQQKNALFAISIQKTSGSKFKLGM